MSRTGCPSNSPPLNAQLTLVTESPLFTRKSGVVGRGHVDLDVEVSRRMRDQLLPLGVSHLLDRPLGRTVDGRPPRSELGRPMAAALGVDRAHDPGKEVEHVRWLGSSSGYCIRSAMSRPVAGSYLTACTYPDMGHRCGFVAWAECPFPTARARRCSAVMWPAPTCSAACWSTRPRCRRSSTGPRSPGPSRPDCVGIWTGRRWTPATHPGRPRRDRRGRPAPPGRAVGWLVVCPWVRVGEEVVRTMGMAARSTRSSRSPSTSCASRCSTRWTPAAERFFRTCQVD